MRKLIVLLFAVGLLLSVSAPAFANNGRDYTGYPGRGDNCTSYYNSGWNWPNWHACD